MADAITTERLLLRPWRDEDLAAFAALNADPQVMEHFPQPMDRAQSDRLAGLIRAHFAQHGFGLWAAQLRRGDRFIGFVGLSTPTFEAHFTPAIEIGWRLARDHWGYGYATEGARAALAHGFEQLGLQQVVSFTVPQNRRSRRVMDRLGMQHDPADDFDHPRLSPDSPLCRHVLYRIHRDDWLATQRA